MHTQYVATQSSSNCGFVAPQSQPAVSRSVSYLLHRFSRRFPQGYTQVAYPQIARGVRLWTGALRVENRDRRLTCRRASRAFSQYPCWPSWQHAVARTMQVTLKNSWSLTRFQSQSSRLSAASTTKVVLKNSGQASAPVPRRAPMIGGAA